MAGCGLAVLQRNRAAHSENRRVHGEDRLDHNENHHNIRRFSSKSRFSSNVGTVWKPPTTTKVPVPIVVVPNNGYAEALVLRRLRIVWITMSSSNSRMAITTMSTANSRLPQWRPASDFCLSTSFLLYLVAICFHLYKLLPISI